MHIYSYLITWSFFLSHRRNELLLGSKPTIIRQAAAAASEDEKIRKFATAIVEFSQVTDPVTQYCNVTLTVRRDTNVSNVY